MRKLIESIETGLDELRKHLNVETAEFVTEDEYDNGDDCIYELPRVWEVSKHMYHIEFVIMKIDKGVVECGSLGEDYGYTKKFKLSELSLDEMLMVANEIY